MIFHYLHLCVRGGNISFMIYDVNTGNFHRLLCVIKCLSYVFFQLIDHVYMCL